MSDLLGIEVGKVTVWMERHINGVRGPLVFELIAGGHSNLTYRVADSTGRVMVLRRPPMGHLLASAHDMSREFRIIDALAHTEVPVAPALGLCEDATVNGAPFYVMGFVDGLVIRNPEQAAAHFSMDARLRASESLVDTLARIHSVDPVAVGLGTLGRHDAYIARQLKRWYGQWEQSKTRELPEVDDTFQLLSERIPDQVGVSIVHGDYRLDNCIAGPDGLIRAVLDWEISTLGDALADAGLLYVYWGIDGGSQEAALPTAPTSLNGFFDRDAAMTRYGAASGRDMSHIDFYIAFGFWKMPASWTVSTPATDMVRWANATQSPWPGS